MRVKRCRQNPSGSSPRHICCTICCVLKSKQGGKERVNGRERMTTYLHLIDSLTFFEGTKRTILIRLPSFSCSPYSLPPSPLPPTPTPARPTSERFQFFMLVYGNKTAHKTTRSNRTKDVLHLTAFFYVLRGHKYTILTSPHPPPLHPPQYSSRPTPVTSAHQCKA